jgi:lycopene beta-cyclase
MKTQAYDIIFLGAGLANLVILKKALQAGLWQEKNILLLDNDLEKNPDKMISFWRSKSQPLFIKPDYSWTKMTVFDRSGNETKLDSETYHYHSVDAGRLYQNIKNRLKDYSNIILMNGKVTTIENKDGRCNVETESNRFSSKICFNSIPDLPKDSAKHQVFLQHFKGWKIKIKDQNVLDPETAVIMDYRTSQENGTSFFYCLPLSESEIFVEYTIFSKKILQQEDYVTAIKNYLSDVLKIQHYEIWGEEFGIIPMTDFPFQRRKGNIVNVGTAGGDTRGSTGYTFSNVLKTADAILEHYKNKKNFDVRLPRYAKERFYDALLLDVLDAGKYPGHKLFSDLFRKSRSRYIFRFLDSESNIINDLRVIFALRFYPFLKVLFKRLLR